MVSTFCLGFFTATDYIMKGLMRKNYIQYEQLKLQQYILPYLYVCIVAVCTAAVKIEYNTMVKMTKRGVFLWQ